MQAPSSSKEFKRVAELAIFLVSLEMKLWDIHFDLVNDVRNIREPRLEALANMDRVLAGHVVRDDNAVEVLGALEGIDPDDSPDRACKGEIRVGVSEAMAQSVVGVPI